MVILNNFCELIAQQGIKEVHDRPKSVLIRRDESPLDTSLNSLFTLNHGFLTFLIYLLNLVHLS